MRCLGNCLKTIFAPENPSIWRLWTLTVYLERSAGKPTHSLVVVQASTKHSDCAIYIYIFHVVLFPPLLQKAEILVVLVKKSLFVQKKRRCNVAVWSGNVAVWSGNVAVCSGNVAVWSGNVAVAKSLIIWKISKNAVPHKKKGRSFGKAVFRAKGRNLASFWRCRYIISTATSSDLSGFSAAPCCTDVTRTSISTEKRSRYRTPRVHTPQNRMHVSLSNQGIPVCQLHGWQDLTGYTVIIKKNNYCWRLTWQDLHSKSCQLIRG